MEESLDAVSTAPVAQRCDKPGIAGWKFHREKRKRRGNRETGYNGINTSSDILMATQVWTDTYMIKNPVLQIGMEKKPEALMLDFFQPWKRNNLLIIGTDEGTLIAVYDNGQLVSVDPDTLEFIRYMNASPTHLVQCIAAYVSYGVAVSETTTEEQALDCVKSFETAINKADASALGKADNWWSCIVAQAYEGNL